MKFRSEFWAAAVFAGYLCLDKSGISLWVLLAAVVHEAGHLLAMLLLGQKPDSFQIGVFGAAIKKERGKPLVEMIISAAGPFFGLLLFILLYFSDRKAGAAASLVLTVFNLFPVYPLDGWRLLDLVLSRKMAPDAVRKAEAAAAAATVILVVVFLFLTAKRI